VSEKGSSKGTISFGSYLMNPSTTLFASRRMCGIAHTMVYDSML